MPGSHVLPVDDKPRHHLWLIIMINAAGDVHVGDLSLRVDDKRRHHLWLIIMINAAGDLHVGDLSRPSPYRVPDGHHRDLPTASQGEANAAADLTRSPTMKTMGDDLEVSMPREITAQ